MVIIALLGFGVFAVLISLVKTPSSSSWLLRWLFRWLMKWLRVFSELPSWSRLEGVEEEWKSSSLAWITFLRTSPCRQSFSRKQGKIWVLNWNLSFIFFLLIFLVLKKSSQWASFLSFFFWTPKVIAIIER